MVLGAGHDTATGGSGGDTLWGGDGNDTLNGADGNDTLDGGSGNNTLSGGAGSDIVTLVANGTGSANGGADTDHLRFDFYAAASGITISLSASGGVISGNVGGTSVSGFETLNTFINQASDGNDTITIASSVTAGVIVGLRFGNDTYSGGSGNDYVEGGMGNDTLGGGVAGNDTLIGGQGDDTYVVENATTTLTEVAGQGTDTVQSSISWALGDEFENLTLTGIANINGTGTLGANVLTGNSGANRFEAGAGNDTLHGGDGADQLYGMEGDDTVNGDGGSDSIEDGVGTNTLNGGGGDDHIFFSGDAVNNANGGLGTDLLYISSFNRTSGFVIDLTGMWTGGSGTVNGGTVTGFEALVGFDGTQWDDVINFGAGTSTDYLGINDAGAGNDTLTGTDGINYINGGEGNDTIVTGAGNDEILGGAGDDRITIRATTAGTVSGGEGTDTLALAPAEPDALDIDLTLLWGGGAGTVNGVTVTGIELLETLFIQSDHFVLSVADNVVIGAGYTGNLTMQVGRGADIVSGGSGNDIINGEQDDDIIRGGAGNDSLSGSYASDYVYGDAGDDNISGDTLDVEWTSGNDHLYGGDGNDTIEGGAFQDWLYGEADNDVLRGDSLALDNSEHGNDLLDGGAGIDQLFGLAGNDTLIGGTGVDTMAGGLGNDWFYVDTAADVVTEAAGEGSDRVFASATYTLGAGVEVELMTTSDNAGTTAINLTGNELVNSLVGNAGNNTLNGGIGADTMNGLTGDDWFYVDNASDVVIEASGGGTDRIFTSVNYAISAGRHIELMTTTNNAGTGAISLTGNELVNSLVGNAGNNTLDGRGGADTLNGLGGDDYYIVDSISDVVIEASGGGTDRVFTSVSYALGATRHIELMTTTDGAGTTAISLTGNELVNSLVGNAGNNTLDGRAGADTLNGQGGDDYYIVDDVSDVVIEASGGGTDRVFTSVSYVLGATRHIEMLTTTDSAATTALNLTGNELVNSIVGNAGNNTLDGRGGADTLSGLGGNDYYLVDNAADAVIEVAGLGTDRVFASISYTLGAGVHVEMLTTNDSAATTALNLTGNELANFLVGNAGNNTLNGGGGADTLSGLGGDDWFYVDNASDAVVEGAGLGTDRVFASVSYTLSAGQHVETMSTTDSAGTTALNLTGNELANSIVGNAGANILNGGLGADTLNGFGGADTFQFSTALGGGNVDAIQGYGVADDVIQLDDAVFAGLALGALAAGAFNTGAAATQADDRIVYNSATGALLFDADGVGGAAGVQFATVTAGLAMAASEFFVI
jgi:Ca2+-binding RTX toxin-like protein